VRGEIMGSQQCRIVGKSQPVLIRINPMIFTRTRHAHTRAHTPPSFPGRQAQPSPARVVQTASGMHDAAPKAEARQHRLVGLACCRAPGDVPVQSGYLLRRGGGPNRWHSLVNCSHGDSSSSRFGLTRRSPWPLGGCPRRSGAGPRCRSGRAGLGAAGSRRGGA
jgi:hypothetical protein